MIRRYATLAAMLLLAACIEIKDGPDKKSADSAAGNVVSGTTDDAATAATTLPTSGGDAHVGPDSATRIRGGPLGTPEAAAALQTDTAHSITEIGTSTASMTPASDVDALKGHLLLPVRGVVASALYDTYNEKRGDGTRTHEALDIPAPRGTPVLSATGGRVLKLFNSKAGGNMVYASDSSERFILMYAHLDSYANGLAEGQPLQRGQVLGAVGTTGNAPPNLPHLHFAIARSSDVKQWWKGAPVNPYPLLVP